MPDLQEDIQKVSNFLILTYNSLLDKLINRVNIIESEIKEVDDIAVIITSSIDQTISEQISIVDLGITQEQIDVIKTDNIAEPKAQARSYTDSQIALLRSELATAKSEAIDDATQYATSKANEAKSEAITATAEYATTKANEAKSEAITAASTYTTTKMDAAKSEAITFASTSTTTKMDATKRSAITAVAPYTTTKMDVAKTTAINTAALDAKTKMDTALVDAKNYAYSVLPRRNGATK